MKSERTSNRLPAQRPHDAESNRRRAVVSFAKIFERRAKEPTANGEISPDPAGVPPDRTAADPTRPSAADTLYAAADPARRHRQPADDGEGEPIGLADARPAELRRMAGDPCVGPKDPTGAPALDPAFDRIIREAVLMQDSHRRKRLSLRLDVPGRGPLHVSIRRGAHGTEVQFQSEASDLIETVRRRRGDLLERARANGVSIARVDVSYL